MDGAKKKKRPMGLDLMGRCTRRPRWECGFQRASCGKGLDDRRGRNQLGKSLSLVKGADNIRDNVNRVDYINDSLWCPVSPFLH